MLNALTIDVEDYFQVSNFEKMVGFSRWGEYESRVVDNTLKILNILAENDVKATFFVLGWVAEKFPELIKEIYSQGHEIASHGYNHRLIYQQSPEEFRQDIKKTKVILEGLTEKKPILGYRAASYSITKESFWALDILSEEGFKYDSSIFPGRHHIGGLPHSNSYFHKIENSNGGIWEFPISTIHILGQSVSFAAGGYFRLFPYRVIKWGIKSINERGYPATVLIHPWELDTGQPRFKTRMIDMFRQYYNLSRTGDKLRRLLSDFKFRTVKEVLGL
jgi:polysaccharide deacetylase family protein (PEP-CTERM system associated)